MIGSALGIFFLFVFFWNTTYDFSGNMETSMVLVGCGILLSSLEA